ncbi:MAG TPA: N-formylglutamate amidohydrolase, partial [Alphaproteobacteria bacterium]
MSVMENSKDYIAGVYRVERPTRPLPLVFDSPHSGREYPEDFGHACPISLLAAAEDNYVDDLFDCVPAAGGTLLTALFPRTYIDVNRNLSEIDTEMLREPWPDGDEESAPGPRARAGIGLLRRLLRPGIEIYDRKLDVSELKQRIENYYEPYHAVLDNILREVKTRHNRVWHINCHSMPAAQPDFCIGDRDGTSCSGEFTEAIKDYLTGIGYKVYINRPYKGLEIVRRHGAPAQGSHSLQLEISKALYWSDSKNRKSSNYNLLKSDVQKLVLFCAAWVEAQIGAQTTPQILA